MKISLIMPGRNNRKYAEWSYNSIQKNKGSHDVEICFADDASTDETWKWAEDLMKRDSSFKAIRNNSGVRVGHTVLYDRLIDEVATSDLCMIWHCDMYLCPGALDAIEEHMYGRIPVDRAPGGWEVYKKEKTIVSLTRIEPPLHPPGPEKIVSDWGIEPEEFDEEAFGYYLFGLKEDPQFSKKTTEGIFAPWAFWKDEFQEIGGHDKLFAPQSKEDSDIFNRFHLNGTKFIQTWEGFVYHMTCRGSRFNPALTTPGINSPEWEAQNIRSARNFIRKWGSYVEHDEYMKPIVTPKYNVIFNIEGTPSVDFLKLVEPWCTLINVKPGPYLQYIEEEQKNTTIDLKEKLWAHKYRDETHMAMTGVLVRIDCANFTNQDYQYMQLLPKVIQQQGVVGQSSELGNLKVYIVDLNTYEKDLIKLA